jgi:hypothetical protein
MKDYRQPCYRLEYFSALYNMNLEQKVMPGLVYLYLPELAKRYNWDAEQKLWFAFLNGMTQNPITSLRMFDRLPSVPPPGATLVNFETWFNDNWDTLQFDTDRRYQKKDTVEAIRKYAALVSLHGAQQAMLIGTYAKLWKLVYENYHGFGRLSSFSYLEYVHLLGHGAACTDLLFGDKSGSKSHRNGMMFLLGQDAFVWDKRLPNGFDGDYDFKKIVPYLNSEAAVFLEGFSLSHPYAPNTGYFTLESNLCTFKNSFFGRRAPGSYADMAWERIVWHDERGLSEHTEIFKKIREDNLPEWLRMECSDEKLSISQKAAMFAETGYPHRGKFFLP